MAGSNGPNTEELASVILGRIAEGVSRQRFTSICKTSFQPAVLGNCLRTGPQMFRFQNSTIGCFLTHIYSVGNSSGPVEKVLVVLALVADFLFYRDHESWMRCIAHP